MCCSVEVLKCIFENHLTWLIPTKKEGCPNFRFKSFTSFNKLCWKGTSSQVVFKSLRVLYGNPYMSWYGTYTFSLFVFTLVKRIFCFFLPWIRKRTDHRYLFHNHFSFFSGAFETILTAQKWSFPLNISSVNVTKSTGNCRFVHLYSSNL